MQLLRLHGDIAFSIHFHHLRGQSNNSGMISLSFEEQKRILSLSQLIELFSIFTSHPYLSIVNPAQAQATAAATAAEDAAAMNDEEKHVEYNSSAIDAFYHQYADKRFIEQELYRWQQRISQFISSPEQQALFYFIPELMSLLEILRGNQGSFNTSSSIAPSVGGTVYDTLFYKSPIAPIAVYLDNAYVADEDENQAQSGRIHCLSALKVYLLHTKATMLYCYPTPYLTKNDIKRILDECYANYSHHIRPRSNGHRIVAASTKDFSMLLKILQGDTSLVLLEMYRIFSSHAYNNNQDGDFGTHQEISLAILAGLAHLSRIVHVSGNMRELSQARINLDGGEDPSFLEEVFLEVATLLNGLEYPIEVSLVKYFDTAV